MRTGGRKWRMFASFAVRNYRYYFLGALVSNVGTWVQAIGQAWLVLTILTDNSSAALGTVTALQFIALPVLAPFAGAVTDRFSKRHQLMVTQMLLALLAFGLFALVLTDVVQLWHVYLFAFTQGIITAFDNPARQAFVTEMVDRELVPNAVGLNSTSFNMARLVGPGVAGLLIAAFGVALTLLINAVTFAAMLAALFLMNADELTPAPATRGRGAARDGLRYLGKRPDLIIYLVVVFMLGSFGMHFQLFNATMSTTVFGQGAEAFGLLGTVLAVGTLAGALMAARRTKPSLRIIMLGLAGYTVSMLLLSVAPNFTIYALLLIPAGFSTLTVMTSCNAAVQLGTAPEFRGRVMAVYMAIFVGGTPLGAPLIGWVGEVLGARASILIGPTAVGLTLIGVMSYLVVHKGVRLRLQKGHVEVWYQTRPRPAADAADPGAEQ